MTPDITIDRPNGQIDVVSREHLAETLAQAAVVLDMIGGHLSVVQHRVATGVPGEAVTVSAVIEWRDRTDAKPQPEQVVAQPAAQQPPTAPEPVVQTSSALPGDTAKMEAMFGSLPEDVQAQLLALVNQELPVDEDVPLSDGPVDEVGDGLVPMDEEDVSEIPANLR